MDAFRAIFTPPLLIFPVMDLCPPIALSPSSLGSIRLKFEYTEPIVDFSSTDAFVLEGRLTSIIPVEELMEIGAVWFTLVKTASIFPVELCAVTGPVTLLSLI